MSHNNILEISRTITALKEKDGSLKRDTLEELKRINPTLETILKVMHIIWRMA